MQFCSLLTKPLWDQFWVALPVLEVPHPDAVAWVTLSLALWPRDPSQQQCWGGLLLTAS